MIKDLQGTVVQNVTLDPDEFRGMSRARTEAEVRATLHSIAPGVSFFDQDIEALADDVFLAVLKAS